MAYTGLATKVYKDPLTVTWMNSIKENFDEFEKNRVVDAWFSADLTGVGLTIHKSLNINAINYNGAAGKYEVVFTSGFTSVYYLFLGLGSDLPANPSVCCGLETAAAQVAGGVDTLWLGLDGNPKNPSQAHFIGLCTGTVVG